MIQARLLSICAILLTITPLAYSMEYVPTCFKKAGTWKAIGAVALAATVSGAIYCIEYWQEAPNRNLFEGVSRGDVKKVALALYDGAQYDRVAKDGSTLLHYAVRAGHYDLVPLLTDPSLSGISLINKEDRAGNTPLYYAAQHNDARMVQLLLRLGANYLCTADENELLQQRIKNLASQKII